MPEDTPGFLIDQIFRFHAHRSLTHEEFAALVAEHNPEGVDCVLGISASESPEDEYLPASLHVQSNDLGAVSQLIASLLDTEGPLSFEDILVTDRNREPDPFAAL